jgi:hypothetical protein
MNTLSDEHAIIERVRRRYYQPGQFERGLKILAQEINDRSQRAAIARRVSTLLREREASGVEQERIQDELKAAAKEARDLDASSPFNAALQAAALLALKLSSFHDCKAAPAVLQALLGCAGAAEVVDRAIVVRPEGRPETLGGWRK